MNSLEYFNTANNFSVDIIHGILEGAGQFEMKLVLKYIESNFLNAEQVAGRIHGFNQQRNRPPLPTDKLLDRSNGLGLNAIQSWCLLRNMPLLFGDLIQIQTDDKHWHLLLLLLHIVNIVFSPLLSEGMTVYLKHLITDHRRLFKQLFPDINL